MEHVCQSEKLLAFTYMVHHLDECDRDTVDQRGKKPDENVFSQLRGNPRALDVHTAAQYNCHNVSKYLMYHKSLL